MNILMRQQKFCKPTLLSILKIPNNYFLVNVINNFKSFIQGSQYRFCKSKRYGKSNNFYEDDHRQT
ncbi:hypothetical protein Syun_005872 [Stephania yunnanensis]|uniref:Uncharacterized protein n=1 Tax=Stephania yunnanensis TaxID=152371 RepID=A0AAP0KVK2_9MAGN